MEITDSLICALLRGEAPPMQGDDEALLERIALHGVGPLLWDRVASRSWGTPCLRETLRAIALDRAVWEMQHQAMLREVLLRLARAGIEPVIIKGTALGYSLYRDPTLRARGDTDIFIAPDSRERAGEELEALGFAPQPGVQGEHIAYQRSYTREGAGGHAHTIDVHWKINNSKVLARLFSHAELRASAQRVPALASEALMPAPVLHLLIVCMHRATHVHNPYWVGGVPHYGGERLIWLCDVDLLARALGDADWDILAALAQAKGLVGTLLDALRESARCLGTPVPPRAIERLASVARGHASDYLAATTMRQHWLDFGALDGSRNRFVYLRELFFPGRDYMRSKYGDAHSPLAWLYLRRAWSGLAKRIGG
jgi:hypothetical protein